MSPSLSGVSGGGGGSGVSEASPSIDSLFQASAGFVAQDGSYLYAGGATIWWANLPNGDGSAVLFPSTPPANFVGVVVDDTYIYGTDVGGSCVWRAPKDGSAPFTQFITSTPDPGPPASDGTYLYWLNFLTGDLWRALQADGSGAAVIAPALVAGVNVWQPIVADGHIFIPRHDTAEVLRLNLDGSSLSTFASVPAAQVGCTDGTYLYVLDIDAGDLYRVAVADGAVTPLGTLPGAFIGGGFQIATDGTYIYLPNGTDAVIQRVAVSGITPRTEAVALPGSPAPAWSVPTRTPSGDVAWLPGIQGLDVGVVLVELHDSGPIPERPVQAFLALDGQQARTGVTGIVAQLKGSAPVMAQGIDILAPGGHMGPHVDWGSDFDFSISRMEYGAVRLDGSASFRVTLTTSPLGVTGGSSPPGGTYNTSMLNWGSPVVTGTDLSLDAGQGNQAIKTDAGGAIWEYCVIEAGAVS